MKNAFVLKHFVYAVVFGLLTAASTMLIIKVLLKYPSIMFVALGATLALYLSLKMYFFLRHKAKLQVLNKEFEEILNDLTETAKIVSEKKQSKSKNNEKA